MRKGLFQVLPSVFRRTGNELEVETDFCESLRLYVANFNSVTIACPITEETADSGLGRCRPLKDLTWRDKVKIISLPVARRPTDILRHYQSIKKILESEIDDAEYLLFSPCSVVGDWPRIAARIAIKMKRRYAIDADVVYDQVAQINWKPNVSWSRWVKRRLALAMFRRSYHYCLKHSAVSLLQGQDVFDAFAPFSPNPHKTYHMPVSKDDFIANSELQHKVGSLTDHRALRICYVGRAIEMKGPMDWLLTIAELINSGLEITANWLGDGSLLSAMKTKAAELGIANFVFFSGFVSDRSKIMQTLKEADIFLFCHKTPESPRCLVEALVSGCPIVGYGSSYPRDLVKLHGGGRFVEIGRWRELAELVKTLSKDTAVLGELMRSAATSGRMFERDATMQHRIDLIKTYCKPAKDSAAA